MKARQTAKLLRAKRETLSDTPRTAKLFQNGRSLAVRIPRDLLQKGMKAGTTVTIAKAGDRIVIEPAPTDLLAALRALPPLGPDDQMPEIKRHPARAFRFPDDLNPQRRRRGR